MNNFPATLSSRVPAPRPASFDLRIVLLLLLVGTIDFFSGRKLFRHH